MLGSPLTSYYSVVITYSNSKDCCGWSPNPGGDRQRVQAKGAGLEGGWGSWDEQGHNLPALKAKGMERPLLSQMGEGKKTEEQKAWT